eukprot:Partr_v1_DN28228_c2_g1_i2_m75690 putative cytochrome P450
MELLEYLIIILPAVYLVYGILKRKQIARLGELPHVFQLLPISNKFVMAGLFPEWLLPYQRTFYWEAKHKRAYQGFGDDIFAIASLYQATIVVANADIVKEICGDRLRFPKPTGGLQVINQFGCNIISTDGDDWKRHRKVAAPSFSERNNRLVHEQTLRLCTQMMSAWERDMKQAQSRAVVVDVAADMVKFALHVISSAGFGRQTNWDQVDEVPAGHTMSYHEALDTVSAKLIVRFVVPRWAYLLPVPMFRHVDTAFKEFRSYMQEMVTESRRQFASGEVKETADLLNSLVQAGDSFDGAGKSILDSSELFGDMFAFLLAGHETTAHTLTYTLGMLALHPDIQQRLFESVEEVLHGGRAPNYEDYADLDYTGAVIYEILRLFPPTSDIVKMVADDTLLGGKYHVSKDLLITIHITGLHRNPKYWKDPDTFDPSRFLKANIESIYPGSYLPFSDGPRSCIGRRFSMVESVCMLAMIIQKYRIDLAEPKDRDHLLDSKPVLTLTPVKAVNLKISKR